MSVSRTIGLTLTGCAALVLAGCTTTSVYLPSKRMCEATGGTYVGTTCNPGSPNARTAKQMCEGHGGSYVSDLDSCQLGSK